MKNKHVLTMFAVSMLVYSAWRSYDYMSGSLSGVSDTVRLLVAVAFLSFSEIGLLIWLHVAQPNATTEIQETTSTAMIWVDFAGSMIVGLGDMIKHNTLYVMDLTVIDPLLFLAPWLMVVLNVGGYLIYHSNDSEEKLDREERRLRHQEVKLEMAARREAIRHLEDSKAEIAEKLAPAYYKAIRAKVEGKTFARFDQPAAPAAPPAAPVNGKVKDPLPLNTTTDLIVMATPEVNGNGQGESKGNPTSRRTR